MFCVCYRPLNQATTATATVVVSAADPSTTGAMATEKTADVSKATPVSGREMEDISESESDSDSEREDTAPVS